MTAVSLLVINYRAAALAVEAIRTARAATAHLLQVVAVDNSADDGEARLLRGAADVVIVSTHNRGYAGGINDGRRACDGEVIVVCNPDVTFGAGAIDALVDADAAVAGPALFWDEGHEWMLPPAELQTAAEVCDRAVASRSRGWARRRDRRRFIERVAFWSLCEPTRVRALSGAVMAIRAAAFDDAGGFDERFPLYFEENDFLRRVAGSIAYVPAARCRHLYNQSASGSADAAAKYAESERLYLRKWGGTVAKSLEHALLPAVGVESRMKALSADVVIEASPLPNFDTAAGHFGDAEVPDDVWRVYRGEVLHLRAVERVTGRIAAVWAKMRS
jgi:GT2 family glycosyltransferase